MEMKWYCLFRHVYACIYLSVIYLLVNQIYPSIICLSIYPSIYISVIYVSTNIFYNSPTNLSAIYLSLYHLIIKLIYHLSLYLPVQFLYQIFVSLPSLLSLTVVFPIVIVSRKGQTFSISLCLC